MIRLNFLKKPLITVESKFVKSNKDLFFYNYKRKKCTKFDLIGNQILKNHFCSFGFETVKYETLIM